MYLSFSIATKGYLAFGAHGFASVSVNLPWVPEVFS